MRDRESSGSGLIENLFSDKNKRQLFHRIQDVIGKSMIILQIYGDDLGNTALIHNHAI
jgi:hypothetical protein